MRLAIVCLLCVVSALALTRPDFDKMWAAKKGQSTSSGAAIDVTDFLVELNKDDYSTVTLSWHSASVKLIVCTNRYWSQSNEHWYALSASTASPYVHQTSPFEGCYYRIISGSYTSKYDVGKLTCSMTPGNNDDNLPGYNWISCPFIVSPNTYNDVFGDQLTYDEALFDIIQQQWQDIGDPNILDTFCYAGTWTDIMSEDGRVVPGKMYYLHIEQTHETPKTITYAGKVPDVGITNTVRVQLQTPNWVGAPSPMLRLITANGITYPVDQDGYVDSYDEQIDYIGDGNIRNYYFDSGTWEDFMGGSQMQRPGFGGFLTFTAVGNGSTWICPATRNENTPVLYE